jgi:hypothetical protein
MDYRHGHRDAVRIVELDKSVTEPGYVSYAEHYWIGSYNYWNNNYDCRPGYTLAKLFFVSSDT